MEPQTPITEVAPMPAQSRIYPSNTRRFVILSTILIVLLALLALVFVAYNSQNTQNTNNTNQNVVDNNDSENVEPTDENPEEEDQDEDTNVSDQSTFVSANFNFELQYPEALGEVSSEFDNKNPDVCSKEDLEFSNNPDVTVTIYADMFQGAQTCLPAFGGTLLGEYYDLEDASENGYNGASLESSEGVFQSFANTVVNSDLPRFKVLVTVKSGSQEESESLLEELLEGITFEEGLK